MRTALLVSMTCIMLFMVGCKASNDIDPDHANEFRGNVYLLATRVDLREEPDITSDIVAVLERDAQVTVITRTDDKAWAKVKHEQWNGKIVEGWIPTTALGQNVQPQ